MIKTEKGRRERIGKINEKQKIKKKQKKLVRVRKIKKR